MSQDLVNEIGSNSGSSDHATEHLPIESLLSKSYDQLVAAHSVLRPGQIPNSTRNKNINLQSYIDSNVAGVKKK